MCPGPYLSNAIPKKVMPIFCQCRERKAIWGLPTCEWSQHFHLQTIFLLKQLVRNLSLHTFWYLRFPSPPVVTECACCLPFPMAGSEVSVSSSFLRQLLLSIHLPSHKLDWYPRGLWSSSMRTLFHEDLMLSFLSVKFWEKANINTWVQATLLNHRHTYPYIPSLYL